MWVKREIIMVECCFTSTETVGLLGTGAQDGYLDFHTAPELSKIMMNELAAFIVTYNRLQFNIVE